MNCPTASLYICESNSGRDSKLPPFEIDPPILCHIGVATRDRENLSVVGRMLTDMSNRDMKAQITVDDVFADPVAYLAQFGITAELVADTTLPAAA